MASVAAPRLQRMIGPLAPSLVFRPLPLDRIIKRPEIEERGEAIGVLGQLQAAALSGRPLSVRLVATPEVYAAIAESFQFDQITPVLSGSPENSVRLVGSGERPDMVLVVAAGMSLEMVESAAKLEDEPSDLELPADQGSQAVRRPARVIWVTEGYPAARRWLEVAGQFDLRVAADLEVGFQLASGLGAIGVTIAPMGALMGEHAASAAEALACDPSSETMLDGQTLGQLISLGQAAPPYSRANWNAFKELSGPGRILTADHKGVAAEHTMQARLRQIALGESVWPVAVEAISQAEPATEAQYEVPMSAFGKVHISREGGTLDVEAKGGEVVWRAQIGNRRLEADFLGSLPLKQIAPQGPLFVELRGHGDVPGQLHLAFMSAGGRPLGSLWYPWNRRHLVVPPKGTARVRFGLRTLESGEVRFTSLRLGGSPMPEPLPLEWARSGTLILAPGYPRYENPYPMAFVHSRVKAYGRLGLEVDVVDVNNPTAVKNWREFDGQQVLTAGTSLASALLAADRYSHVAVHFMKPHMWEQIRPHVDRLSLTIWIHGADIQPWWRREAWAPSAALEPVTDPKERRELRKEKVRHTERIMSMWRDVAAQAAAGADIRFVVVSNSFREEIHQDLAKSGFGLPDERVHVVPNGIDLELFKYRQRQAEQRKRILMVRTFQTRKYGTDIATAAITELSQEPWFGDLEFLIVGDGELWDQDTAPLAKLANVELRRGLVTHRELADLQNEYGVMLQPTRWDSQGVSRDEAMAAGMVVITNDVAAVGEYLSDEEGYLAGPEDSHGMAQAIRELYHQPDTFLAKSAAAAARVARTLDADRLAAQEIAVIRRDS
ncbi:MAG: glycosyltransferase family 4 protein [Bifidobacteriaceae bacterium]|jgi:glycosyltransferase involved in cell wall biosynthesis|nr:glycosyltransferase family 4 protein [Bifidobacteriaceae bacterium]